MKADDKVRARLDAYESSRTVSESTEDALNQAREDLIAILGLIKSGASASSSLTSQQGSQDEGRRRGKDLLDLDENELREDQRESITSEIALFRERIARGKEEKDRLARQAKQAIDASARPAVTRPPVGASAESGFARAGQVDPQSYAKPVPFVGGGSPTVGGAQGAAGIASPVVAPSVSDVQKERERVERAAREAEAAFKEVRRPWSFHLPVRLEPDVDS